MADKETNNPSLTNRKSQDIIDRVSSSLPVRLNAQDVEKHPEFLRLMSSLSQHLDEDGMTQSTKQDITEAKEFLKHTRSKWLQQQLLYEELQELLLDQDIAASSQQPASQQFYQAVQDCLSLAEIGDYLHCSADPAASVTLLGLQKEDIQRKNPHRRHLQSIQQQLIPEVEARLRKKCENLVAFHDSSERNKHDKDGKFTFAKASQLPGVLETELQYLDGQKKLLQQDKYNRERQFWHYYKAIMESLEVLEKLITRHRLSAQKEKDTITSEWLTARCDAMCLKIRILELQLLCDTYHADTVAALNTIKKNLNAKLHESNQELSQVTQALKAYDGIGMGFETLVNEYTYLCEEIENKRWGMREIKQSLDS